MANTEKLWEYRPNVVTKEESQVYYSALVDLVRKEQDEFTFRGKKVKEPRFKNFFSRDGHPYSYSGMQNESAGWPKEIASLAELAKETLVCEHMTFDSALVNYYPEGAFYVSAHNDKDAMEGTIASFSFGATRTFRIRDIKTYKIVQNIPLEDGSLVVMKPGMQQAFKHELTKTTKKVGGRINVTLRQHQNLTKKRKLGQ
jgi:alkylated DNA repair dioxygenase AlkB